ncbi:MAG: hypothetical protein LW875_04905 [Proteobacteria bacterium]|nr:hypothetical protein [Pseudomonadota bacterium]
MKKLLIANALPMLVVMQAHSNPIDRIIPKDREQLCDTAARWGVKADLRVLSVSLFDGLGLKGGYNYSVDPSYTNGLFTRFDRYYTNVNASTSESINEAAQSDFSVGLSAKHTFEVEFARQFGDACGAITAMPYAWDQLPLNSERVLKNLKEGDMVTMKAHLNLVVSGNFLRSLRWEAVKPLDLDIGGHYLVSGKFQIQVLRLADEKIRLKLIGIRSEEKGVHAGLRYGGVLTVIKVGYLDQGILKVMNLNPLQISFNDGNNDLFMVDYVLDLKDKDVAQAYNSSLRNAGKAQSLKILNPANSVENLREQLLMDLVPIENIFSADQQANRLARVQRAFKGSALSDYKRNNFDFGIRLLRLKAERNYSVNRITSVDRDEARSHYLLNSYLQKSENGFFFSWLKVQKDAQMNAVFTTNEIFEKPVPENLVMSVERKDNRFRPAELEEVKIQLARTIPQDVFRQIDFSQWQFRGRVANNVAVRYQVVMAPDAILEAPVLSQEEIKAKYISYLETVEYKDLIRRDSLARENYDYTAETFAGQTLGREVDQISRKLKIVFSPKEKATDRINALMDLRSNRVFRVTGTGFLTTLLPVEKRDRLMSFKLEMESTDGNRLKFQYGQATLTPIYSRLMYIQSILNNDGLDLRLEAETLSTQVLGQQKSSQKSQ